MSSSTESNGAGFPAADADESFVIERTITLLDGRRCHFSVGGDFRHSRKLFIGLHGVFGVGHMSPHLSRFFASRGWMSLSPTLPGWGTSAPFPENTPVSAYVHDVRQCVDAVMKEFQGAGAAGAKKKEEEAASSSSSSSSAYADPTHIVAFGGSYGSVWAYAVAANSPPTASASSSSSSTAAATPYLSFPPSAIRGLIVMSGFSPFAVDKTSVKHMTWMNYLTVSPVGLWRPFSWLHAQIGRAIRKQIANNIEGSVKMLRMILTGPKAMKEEERRQMNAWCSENGTTFDAWEREMAINMSKSIATTMIGYDAVCPTLNADWGFRLEEIRVPTSAVTTNTTAATASSSRPTLHITASNPLPSVMPAVVIVGATRDHLAPIAMMQWVSERISGAQLVELEGNHISGITSLKKIVGAVIQGIEGDDDAKKSPN